MLSYQLNIHDSPSIRALKISEGVSETSLEQTIGLSLISEYNTQLLNMSRGLQQNLDQKRNAQTEIKYLASFILKEPTDLNGTQGFLLTPEEATNLQNKYPQLNLTQKDGQTYIEKPRLEAFIESKKQDLAALNTDSEMASLQIQTVVDQRKQAITLLSNLIASRDETIMNIVRNIK
ncbi:MAG TPA: hypothetical protein DDW49_05510 [Deltaproteobacteria bacterium]|nr:MAG: hypothetical protein A2048_06225 [Deltaproteobacteria bacterium GWA2_45_12]HBF12832.1 hypothetical protein [Deltaproteobacteria bacterium]